MATVGTRTRARIRRLRTPAIAAIASAALLTPLLAAAPASAASSGVTTPIELAAAFADANVDTVRLDADVDAGTPVSVTSHTLTLDLHGHTLQTANLTLKSGTTLTVVDTGSGGTIRSDARFGAGTRAGITTTGATLDVRSGTIVASGSLDGGAGIGGDAGRDAGTFRMSGGTVTADGGADAAGIGGGMSGRAGSITISGGTVTANGGVYGPGIGNGAGYAGDGAAPVDIVGGTVTAHGGRYSAGAPGVGGGLQAAGVALTVGAAATLTVSDDEGYRGFGGDVLYSRQWGSYVIAGTLVLGNNVGVPEYSGITILAGGVVRGPGAFQQRNVFYSGNAYIDNRGSLQVGVDPRVLVIGNNFTVNFAANRSGATAPWPASLRVYASSLADAALSLPTLPTASDGVAWGWNTDPSGHGTPFATATVLTQGLTVYADWRFLSAARIDVDSDTVTAGDDVALQVVGHEAVADVDSDQTASATFTSDVASDVITGADIRMTQAGTHTITAAIDGFGTVSRQIEVLAGPLDHLTAQLYEQDGAGRGDAIGSGTAATATAGTALMLVATGWDAYDNPTAELPAAVASTGPETVTGQTFTPTSAASRTITATAGGHSTSIALTVLPDDVSRVVITVPSPITAGGTSTVGVVGIDAYDNETDLSSQASVTSSVAGDAVAGNTITATLAGTRTIWATLPGLAPVSSSLQVDAGPLASLTVDASASSVVAGHALGFTAGGLDAYGNPTGDVTAQVTFSTDSPGVSVTDDTIRFVTAGDPTVTATLIVDHAVTSSTTVEVTPGALASVTVTPADTILTAGESTTFAVHGADAWGNPVVITDAITLTSDDATDVVTGDAIAFTTVGDHRVTATLDDAAATSASTTVSIAAAPASSITLEATTTSVRQGGCLSFAVSGTDTFGNPIEQVEGASLSSDQPTDLVDGLTVCFPHASPHRITAHLGTMSSVLLVEVVPALAPTGNALPSALALAALLALLAGLALVARRRMRA